jgi:hypothetical protein
MEAMALDFIAGTLQQSKKDLPFASFPAFYEIAYTIIPGYFALQLWSARPDEQHLFR